MVAAPDYTIHPGVGVGALRLGMSEDEVRGLLGEPEESESRDYGDGVETRDWEYDSVGLSLSFDAEDDFRLGAIIVSDVHATLVGVPVVGLSEAQLLETSFGALGPPVLDDEFGDDAKTYDWDEPNLSSWLDHGVVTSVTVMPRYDESGEVPQWPESAG